MNKVPTMGFLAKSLKLIGNGLAPMLTFLLVAIRIIFYISLDLFDWW